jgi:hypothetical protein
VTHKHKSTCRPIMVRLKEDIKLSPFRRVLKVNYLVFLIEHTGSLNPAYSCETAAPMVSSIEEALYLQ